MVYIRSKKVKGIDYAYLVKSVWNKRKNTSNQQTIKYLATEHVCSNVTNNLIRSINERTDKAKLNFRNKILICTPEGELHNLACNMIESLLLSKGFQIYNISPSVPLDSIIRYVKNVGPDIILRLINEIRSKFHIPVVLGGSATKQIPIGSIIDVIIMRNGSLSEVLNLINSAYTNR
jgi:MerR family transcriptional regulator, light-induced transcriptional regulator